MSACHYASVFIDQGPPQPLDYLIPSHLVGSLEAGSRVKVPLRGKLRTATIQLIKDHCDCAHPLSIVENDPQGTLPFDLMQLAQWISHYYYCSLPFVIRTLLPKSVRKKVAARTQTFVILHPKHPDLNALLPTLKKSHPSQFRLLEYLFTAKKPVLLHDLLHSTKSSRSSLLSLVKKEAIELVEAYDKELDYFPSFPKELNSEQASALASIKESLNEGVFKTLLLHGITGSGKTEVYLQAIDHALQLKKGALMLVPEIALTSQTMERFRSRFQKKVALLHYRLSEGERALEWNRLRSGEALIALGARSAIFSPIPNLGLIIVDEEHEHSYKQSDSAPLYHARDTAVMRGKMKGCTVLLGSATPSLESYCNAQRGKYQLLTLSKRVDGAQIAPVEIVDMEQATKRAQRSTLLSDVLLDEIQKRFQIGEQTLLFLNRRGYHSMQWCPHCRNAMRCPHCDTTLTFHRNAHHLSCHLCNYTLSPPPSVCPLCSGAEPMTFKGAGTEQIERALHAIFPKITTLRIDADTTRHKGSHEKLFKQFRVGKADVLIGTQMIAKGLDFPQVTLVGILNSDLSLHVPDFRSAEHTFQLLTQVCGRTGRSHLGGKVILQTHMPSHQILQLAASQDYLAFYNHEMAIRTQFGFPPTTHLIKVVFSGEDSLQTEQNALQLHEALLTLTRPPYELFPVCPCGHAKIKDRFRFQLLLKGPQVYPLNEILKKALALCSFSKQTRFLIDVDPTNTYF